MKAAICDRCGTMIAEGSYTRLKSHNKFCKNPRRERVKSGVGVYNTFIIEDIPTLNELRKHLQEFLDGLVRGKE